MPAGAGNGGKVNLYDTLGIQRDATGADIRRAYRSKAQQHHPDKGGDKEEFQRIQQAYDVLSNDDRRAQYDAGGGTDPQMSVIDVARGELAKLLLYAVDRVPDLSSTDLRKQMAQAVRENIEEANGKKQAVTKKIERRHQAIQRIKRKGHGENFMVGVLEQDVQRLEQQIKSLDQHKAVFEAMLTLLDDYEYQFEPHTKTGPEAWITIELHSESIREAFRNATKGG